MFSLADLKNIVDRVSLFLWENHDTIKTENNPVRRRVNMDVKLILAILTGLFILTAPFFATKNGFYDSDNYDGNGSAH